MVKELGPGFRLTLVFTLLTGLLYPALMTGLSELVFPKQANGSLLTVDGKLVGSSLIGQNFSRPRYFHPRPSSAGSGYDATASGGSNLGPTSAKLLRGTTKIDEKQNEIVDFDGLSVRVVNDPVARNSFLSEGSFGWSGAFGTHFWVDRKKKLIAIASSQNLR